MTETLTEIANREADEAERESEADEAALAEGATPEPAAEVQAERQTVPKSSLTEAELLDRALKSEDTRHVNALKKIYGEGFAERIRCGICDGEGHVHAGVELLHTLAEAGEQAQLQLGTAYSNLESPDNYVRCTYCGGRGAVATKALTDGTGSIPCKKCQARGYFDTDDPVHRGQLGLAAELAAPPAPMFPQYHIPAAPAANGSELHPPTGWYDSGSPGADQWGRWPGHPRFGIDPSKPGGQW